jgi:hypothetical protein
MAARHVAGILRNKHLASRAWSVTAFCDQVNMLLFLLLVYPLFACTSSSRLHLDALSSMKAKIREEAKEYGLACFFVCWGEGSLRF